MLIVSNSIRSFVLIIVIIIILAVICLRMSVGSCRQHTRHVGGPILWCAGLAFWRTQSNSTLSFHSPLRNIMTSVMTKLRNIIPHASRDQISFLTRQRPNRIYLHLSVRKTRLCVCVCVCVCKHDDDDLIRQQVAARSIRPSLYYIII